MTTPTHEPVTFGERPLRIEDVLALANRQAPVQLQADADYRERIAKGARFLDSLLDKEGVIYGVTTGYGDSCVVAVPLEHVEALPQRRGHGVLKLDVLMAQRRAQAVCGNIGQIHFQLLCQPHATAHRC